MRKNFLFIGSTALAMLLLGAGCNKTAGDLSGNQVTTKSAGEQTQTTGIQEQKSGGFNLAVESRENKTVYVKFDVPEDLKKEAEGYRIMMGKEENPTKENAVNWYQLGKDHMDKMWGGMPAGIRHFRVCVIKDNQCTAYSNNMEIEIK